MFVQVFHGRLADPVLWVAQVARWREEIHPWTTGFLGFTSGVTTDDYMVTVARFESEALARVDSDLPEQGGLVHRVVQGVRRGDHLPRLPGR
jgi:hypothetical protein